MPKFLLLGGKFSDPNVDDGKEYNAGDGVGGRPKRVTVTSDLDLDVMFKNKFERLDGPTKHGRVGEDSDGDTQTDDPPASVKRKMKAAEPREGIADRNKKMTTADRAEIMDEEVGEDGMTEEGREVSEKVDAKVTKRREAEPDDDDEPESDTEGAEEGEEVEKAATTEGEDASVDKPAAARTRGRPKKKYGKKRS